LAKKRARRRENEKKMLKTLNGKNLEISIEERRRSISSVDRSAKFSHSGKIYDKDFYLSRAISLAQQRIKKSWHFNGNPSTRVKIC
jgi:hypothetical protein